MWEYLEIISKLLYLATIRDSILKNATFGLEDYEYIENSGTLDEHNGRYCVTPEYPNGTYAYFVTINEYLDPIFPYTIEDLPYLKY